MSAGYLSRPILFGVLLSGAAQAQPAGPRVTIETTPPGAKVYVDGRDRGMACQSGPNCKPRMSPGSHRIIVEMDGYRPLEEMVNISGPQRFSFKLEPAPAKLEIKTLATAPTASGGEIFLDGKLAGTVPADIEASPGKHMLEVRRPGFLPHAEPLDLKAGELRPVFVALSAETKAALLGGALMITSELNGAEVKVDEQRRGPAPVLVEGLTPGDHIVEIVANDPSVPAWRRNVRVTAGQQTTVYGTFTPNPPPMPIPVEMGPQPLPLAVVARNPDNMYVVTLGTGQTCTTPCTLPVHPGPNTINVSGPGSKVFRQPITVPAAPSQVRVQHFTLSRAIAGPILTLLGIPLLAAGGYYLSQSYTRYWNNGALIGESANAENITAGSILGVHGLAFTIAGLVELGTIKRNRAELINLAEAQRF